MVPIEKIGWQAAESAAPHLSERRLGGNLPVKHNLGHRLEKGLTLIRKLIPWGRSRLR